MRYILLLLVLQPLCALADDNAPPLMHRIDAGVFNARGWTVAESTNGDFSVQMPGPFSDFSMTGGPTAIADHMEGIGGKAPNGIVFTAMKLLYDTQGTASAEFEKFKSGEGLPSPVVKPTTAGGLPALDISYADENLATNQRIILAGEDLFTLTIEWPPGKGPVAIAMYQPFVDSFKVLPKTTPKAENPTIWQHDQLNLAFMRTLTKDVCMKKTIATLSRWGCATQQCRVNVGGATADCVTSAAGDLGDFCANYQSRYIDKSCGPDGLDQDRCSFLGLVKKGICTTPKPANSPAHLSVRHGSRDRCDA